MKRKLPRIEWKKTTRYSGYLLYELWIDGEYANYCMDVSCVKAIKTGTLSPSDNVYILTRSPHNVNPAVALHAFEMVRMI